MQDMLSKIVDMDEKARELTDQAEQIKVDSQKEIAKAKEEIYSKYISRARKRIELNEKTEREFAENQWKKTNDQQQQVLKTMNTLYKQKENEWVSSIVERVTKP